MLDDPAIRGFLHDDYPRLVNAVALACGSFPAAEDAVQEALVRAWSRSERGLEIDVLANWVAAVALNLTRSGWRRSLSERRAQTRLDASPARSDASDVRVDVQRALASLPRRQREVAVLRYLLDLRTAEVATVLGVSEGTVKNSLAKARAALARALSVPESEVDDVED